MDSQRRLSTLKHMLARLTGTEPEAPATPQVSQLSQVPPSDPNARKLQLLRSMLSKLQGS